MVALVLLLGSALGEAAGPFAWTGWSQEAMVRAQRMGHPMVVVLGDSLCPPCRQAEADITSGEASTPLADNLVGIRVDRFERPDVDDFFRTAATVLGADRDYPLAVLLTPEGSPFAVLSGAGRRDRPNGAFTSFALQGARAYQKERQRIESLAAQTIESLRRAQRSERPSHPLDTATVKRALTGTTEALGAGTVVAGASSDSYPHASLLFLLEEHERTGDATLLRMADAVLDFLATRTEPDNLWDLALLLRAYTAAHAATGKPPYREKAEGLARSALQMADPAGFRAVRGTEPGDERVFAGWNGLMIGALAAVGRELDRKDDVEAAKQAALRLLARLGPTEQLKRFAGGAETGGPAFLEDYAFLAEAFLELHDADPRADRWLKEAVSMVEVALARFWDPSEGGFFTADAAHEPLPVRIRSGYDDGRLSANGVMASVLGRLARATGEARYRDLGRRTVDSFLSDLQRAPRGMESLAMAAGELLGPEPPRQAEVPLGPSREVRGPATLTLSADSPSGARGGACDVRVGVVIAPGWQVVAHGVTARDLVGLSVSVPATEVTVSNLRYPTPTGTRDPRGLAPFAVLEGEVAVSMTVRSGLPTSTRAARLQVRIVLQACDRSGCRPPESALLELPLLTEWGR